MRRHHHKWRRSKTGYRTRKQKPIFRDVVIVTHLLAEAGVVIAHKCQTGSGI